jgi:hypothetical protein
MKNVTGADSCFPVGNYKVNNARHIASSHFRVGIRQGRRMLKLKQAGASSRKLSTNKNFGTDSGLGIYQARRCWN